MVLWSRFASMEDKATLRSDLSAMLDFGKAAQYSIVFFAFL